MTGDTPSTDIDTLLQLTTEDINMAIQFSPIIDRNAISCGPHTFNDLFHDRAILFNTLCKAFPEKAWKSRVHDNGDEWHGLFIVGISTPDGPFTYHYKNELWDTFDVTELARAKPYDGHTSKDITRLYSLFSK